MTKRQRLACGTSPPCNFVLNDHKYDQGYYLADDIYPSWSTFMKKISNLKSRDHKHFTKAREAQRKDIERAATKVLTCSGARSFLQQGCLEKYHDMMCDPIQHDHGR